MNHSVLGTYFTVRVLSFSLGAMALSAVRTEAVPLGCGGDRSLLARHISSAWACRGVQRIVQAGCWCFLSLQLVPVPVQAAGWNEHHESLHCLFAQCLAQWTFCHSTSILLVQIKRITQKVELWVPWGRRCNWVALHEAF